MNTPLITIFRIQFYSMILISLAACNETPRDTNSDFEIGVLVGAIGSGQLREDVHSKVFQAGLKELNQRGFHLNLPESQAVSQTGHNTSVFRFLTPNSMPGGTHATFVVISDKKNKSKVGILEIVSMDGFERGKSFEVTVGEISDDGDITFSSVKGTVGEPIPVEITNGLRDRGIDGSTACINVVGALQATQGASACCVLICKVALKYPTEFCAVMRPITKMVGVDFLTSTPQQICKDIVR